MFQRNPQLADIFRLNQATIKAVNIICGARQCISQIGKEGWGSVAMLGFCFGKINRAPVDTAGGAGLKTFHLKTKLIEAVRYG